MTIATAEIKVGHVLDVLADMPAGSVHSCVTSPPYWGLRDYKLEPQTWGDGWTGSLGLEPTIDLFLEHLLEVFRAVRRVLRDDGTAWINLGDSYASTAEGTVNAPQPKGSKTAPDEWANMRPVTGLKPLDLCMIPARFALAMQADGWFLRSQIVWAKGLSFCDSYSGSVMPESVSGWSWQRCRVKVRSKKGKQQSAGHGGPNGGPMRDHSGAEFLDGTVWSPCPGCPRCEPHGGYVLRKGSWRPTSAYELVYQFAKTADYFCDAEVVREEGEAASAERYKYGFAGTGNDGARQSLLAPEGMRYTASGRNLRNVFVINPQPFPEAHFATYPEALVEPIIKVSTPEKGVCPECGAPWARVVEREPSPRLDHRVGYDYDGVNPQATRPRGDQMSPGPTTLGWRPTCGCKLRQNMRQNIPATVLDPFAGSGTTLLVARKLGRHSIGIELNPEYAAMARKRIGDYAPLFASACTGSPAGSS